MIRQVTENDIAECVKVIRESFMTVADEFGFTVENAPRFTAFATTEDRLYWHLNGEHRPMYAFCDNGKIVGYYSLLLQGNNECELNNLCVIPEYRHKGIGEKLLKNAYKVAQELDCNIINIGIVEENKVLRKWYESFGFIHVGTHKFDFFPFTCGYMEKRILKDSFAKVIVDRPLGSTHPQHEDIIYPVNYGYVNGIIAEDGEEQDAYILGVDKPVNEFIGRVIAIIHRKDDVEDKWVVAPEGVTFTKDDIAEKVRFQEQYFDTVIEMKD